MSFFHVYSVKIFDHDMTLFFQTSFGRSMQRLQVIKERYFITILAVLREKIFGNIDNFFEIYCIPRTQISWKMTTFFFERYRPEINPRLHKWWCEQISRRFRSFWGKKKFFEGCQFFFLFLHIRGHRFLEKWLTTFLRDTGLKFVVDCTNGVANEF